MVLTATDNTLLRELRHPNILQFLGSIVQGEEMILITDLSKGNLESTLAKKVRLDLSTVLGYAFDIARGMNYLHQHKPFPILHNHLNPGNLLHDDGGHLKIGEYWIQMLYQRINTSQDLIISGHINGNTVGTISSPSNDTNKDIYSFGLILYQMLEGWNIASNNVDFTHDNSIDLPKFQISRYPGRVQQLMEDCTNKDPLIRPSFAAIINILEEISEGLGKAGCPVC
ncbi:integrin-linked protein kinase 1-like [Impatiens glandulifera]|nr:integrin-linked protein kinase 1-like [Impatiens glandulifera]